MHRLVHVHVLCKHSACAVQTQCRRSADAMLTQYMCSACTVGLPSAKVCGAPRPQPSALAVTRTTSTRATLPQPPMEV
jgi:hypothetical protein